MNLASHAFASMFRTMNELAKSSFVKTGFKFGNGVAIHIVSYITDDDGLVSVLNNLALVMTPVQ